MYMRKGLLARRFAVEEAGAEGGNNFDGSAKSPSAALRKGGDVGSKAT
jgi:hypothetical protein